MAGTHFPWENQVDRKTVISHDGVRISYQSIGTGTEKVVALAHGLGGRLYTWAPLIEALMPEYRIIAWHYRGLFASETPKTIRRLAIPNHAEDLKQILDKEGIEKASVCGWSMGVQVALEFAVLYPERLDKMVLINGTYGHALATGFQPVMRIPGMTMGLQHGIDFLRRHPKLTRSAGRLPATPLVAGLLGQAYGALRRNPQIKQAIKQYTQDVLGESVNNYLRLFQELDAHSTIHNLPEINHPALVIWGDLDFLTPAYLSRRMKRRLKNAQSAHYRLGTHFVLLEYPKKVSGRIKKFLDSTVIPVDVFR
ncbi:MAG: alpha/beta hydrolase [Proteobacteria bacterium]|nr:alpha/beta hydrolase [Pseudomonadota bacterium]